MPIHCLIMVLLVTGVSGLIAEDIRYPADAVVDLSAAPYHLDPTGVADCRAGLQQALNDYSGNITSRHILYLPNGTYRLTGGVVLDTHDDSVSGWNGGSGRGVVLQGQSRDGVVLQLDNNASGFGDVNAAVPVLDFNESQAVAGGQFVAFNTNIFNLTVDVGRGNAGAIGIDFCANNAGGMRDVLVRSSDSGYAGWCGVLLSTIPGPQLLKRIEVVGFDWGIRTASQVNYTTTAEYVTVSHCRLGGIYNDRHSFTIRAFTSNNLGGPALVNAHHDGLVTLVGGTFSDGSGTAIMNDGFMYLRDVHVTGYARVLSDHGSDVAGTSLSEWMSGDGVSLFDDAPAASLGLPIVDTPEPAWGDPSQWVSVADYGAVPGDFSNDAGAFQAAIDAMTAASGPDAGKTVLYLPPVAGETRYDIDATITIPPGIERIVGCFTNLFPRAAAVTDGPLLHVVGSGNQLVIEQLFTGADSNPNPHPIVLNNSNRDVVMRNIHILEGQAYVNTGSGRLFLEDVAATSLRYWGGDPQPVASAIPQFDFGGQDVWARQFDVEQKDLNVRNAGGNLWILGMKNEEDGTQIKTIGGGRTEVLGGVLMPLDVDVGSEPAYIVEDSEFSVVIAGHIRSRLPTPLANHAPIYEILVRETRAGVTRNLAQDHPDLPRRSYSNDQGDTPPVLMIYRSPLRGRRVIRMDLLPDHSWGMEPGPDRALPTERGGRAEFDPFNVDVDQTLSLAPNGAT